MSYTGKQKFTANQSIYQLSDKDRCFPDDTDLWRSVRTGLYCLPCPTCPTWSQFFRDKAEVYINLSLDNWVYTKSIEFKKLVYFTENNVDYHNFTIKFFACLDLYVCMLINTILNLYEKKNIF